MANLANLSGDRPSWPSRLAADNTILLAALLANLLYHPKAQLPSCTCADSAASSLRTTSIRCTIPTFGTATQNLGEEGRSKRHAGLDRTIRSEGAQKNAGEWELGSTTRRL